MTRLRICGAMLVSGILVFGTSRAWTDEKTAATNPTAPEIFPGDAPSVLRHGARFRVAMEGPVGLGEIPVALVEVTNERDRDLTVRETLVVTTPGDTMSLSRVPRASAPQVLATLPIEAELKAGETKRLRLELPRTLTMPYVESTDAAGATVRTARTLSECSVSIRTSQGDAAPEAAANFPGGLGAGEAALTRFGVDLTRGIALETDFVRDRAGRPMTLVLTLTNTSAFELSRVFIEAWPAHQGVAITKVLIDGEGGRAQMFEALKPGETHEISFLLARKSATAPNAAPHDLTISLRAFEALTVTRPVRVWERKLNAAEGAAVLPARPASPRSAASNANRALLRQAIGRMKGR